MTENMQTSVAPGTLTGLERSDPKIRKTATLAAIVASSLLVIVIVVQAGFGLARPAAPVAKAADLVTLRSNEEKQLTTYRYIDRAKGTVSLPVDRAMELLVKEAAASAGEGK
jgi:hypothetical protein